MPDPKTLLVADILLVADMMHAGQQPQQLCSYRTTVKMQKYATPNIFATLRRPFLSMRDFR
jgi:hypothetical protein